MAKPNTFIGFPEGWLRDKPVRLPILENEEEWFALNKLAGLLPQVHPWFAEHADITGAIRSQAQTGKGELERLGISSCFYICGPEFESSGPVLFAKTKSMGDFLKNALGSDQIEFTYLLLTSSKSSESEKFCDLPIAMHRDKPEAIVSHRFGKKASTHFRKISDSQRLSLWEATTKHPRLNQVRLHAAELGIPVFNDFTYGGSESSSSSVEDRKTSSSKPGYSGLGLVLDSINLSSVLPENPGLKAELPRQFSAVMRKCGLKLVE